MSATRPSPIARPAAAPDAAPPPVFDPGVHRTAWWYVALVIVVAVLAAIRWAGPSRSPWRAWGQRRGDHHGDHQGGDETIRVPREPRDPEASAVTLGPSASASSAVEDADAIVSASKSDHPVGNGTHAALAPTHTEPPLAPTAPTHTLAPQPGKWTARQRAVAALQAGAALLLIAIALAPPILDLAERSVRVHHLEHAALLGGGGVLGLVVGLTLRRPGHRMSWERSAPGASGHALALGMVLLGPLVVMAAMIPSTSVWIETHPLVHALEHLALIGLGGVIGLSASLVSTALGWLVVVLVATMAAAFGAMALDHPLGLLLVDVRVLIRTWVPAL